MARWAEFESAMPEMAAEGQRLLYQFGEGLGFLATVRKDGGPRLHPMCPIIANSGLYAFIIPSPKQNDLRRDGRFAMHSFLPVDIDDAFYTTGTAIEILDPEIRQFVNDSYKNAVHENHALFEFHLERCLLTSYRYRGDWPPTYTRWSAG